MEKTHTEHKNTECKSWSPDVLKKKKKVILQLKLTLNKLQRAFNQEENIKGGEGWGVWEVEWMGGEDRGLGGSCLSVLSHDPGDEVRCFWLWREVGSNAWKLNWSLFDVDKTLSVRPSYLLHTGPCSPASCCASRCTDTPALCASQSSAPELYSRTPCTHSGFHNSGHETAAPGRQQRRQQSRKSCMSVLLLFRPGWTTMFQTLIQDKKC